MLAEVSHMRTRRSDLNHHIDIKNTFDLWEESCVPSYCHGNWLAAYVSWKRLFKAVALAERNRLHPKRVLDFGSSVGELGHLLPDQGTSYEFVERDPHAVECFTAELPHAKQFSLDDPPDRQYDWVFAIDSVEHNNNYADLLALIAGKLAPDGILVLSGPTENGLYRLGRRVAGFLGAYHTSKIYDIEMAASAILNRRDGVKLFPWLPLFSLSVWTGSH